MQLLHKKFMPFCCFHAWISSEVLVAASWKKSAEERGVLSVLRRIKNVILNESLQGGHRLIEIIFMPIVVESFVLCGLFVFAAKRSELGARRKAQPLCKTFRRPSEHLYTTEANDLGTLDSHHPLLTVRRLIQSTWTAPHCIQTIRNSLDLERELKVILILILNGSR